MYAAGIWLEEMWVVVRRNPSTTLRAVPLPFGKGGECAVTLRFQCWAGCCSRNENCLLQLPNPCRGGSPRPPAATESITIEPPPNCGAQPQSLPCQREGDHAKRGGGIPQRRGAGLETPTVCGVPPHSRSSRNAAMASTAGGRRDPPLQKGWAVAGGLYYCCDVLGGAPPEFGWMKCRLRCAALETHPPCGVNPHSRSSRNAAMASTAGGRRDPPLQIGWVVAGRGM